MPTLPRRILPLLLVVATFLLPPAFGPAYGPLGVTLVQAQDDPLQVTTRTVDVELILDASGSMAELLPERNPLFSVTLVQVLQRQGDRYVVADTVDIVFA